MSYISEKTLSDLEFKEVCLQIREYCVTDYGQLKAEALKPFKSEKGILKKLKISLVRYHHSQSRTLKTSPTCGGRWRSK